MKEEKTGHGVFSGENDTEISSKLSISILERKPGRSAPLKWRLEESDDEKTMTGTVNTSDHSDFPAVYFGLCIMHHSVC